MININNKPWDKLRSSDILKLLAGTDDETFFFEFKSDDEPPAKLIKEISAFSNTYGGYILLGVNDDKTIGGCTKWNEQRIHATIHDSLTPVPNFDVKRLRPCGKTVFVIKVEEGPLPPYITNKGQIFQRVSSGSFPVNDSAKLSQLYNKSQNQLSKIKQKIELPEVRIDSTCPNNLCGYLDLGFSVTCSEATYFQKKFYKFDFEPIAKLLRSKIPDFSISRVGHSLLISVGCISASDGNGKIALLNEGIHNFIEIMYDGSIRSRLILCSTPNKTEVDNSTIGYFYSVFKEIYLYIFGHDYSNIFIHAQKYEKLTVFKQFVPYYQIAESEDADVRDVFGNYLHKHRTRYGNNLIITGDRVPKNDYITVDRRQLGMWGVKYNTSNLLDELFSSAYFNLGYIDPLSGLTDEKFET